MKTPVPYTVLPGGISPGEKRATDAGLDLGVRAIIGDGMDKHNRRTTLYDFSGRWEKNNRPLGFDGEVRRSGGLWFYYLPPGESISIGLGISVAVPKGYAGFVRPRGSTIKSFVRPGRLEIANDAVPIDPHFEGEIWAEIVNHGALNFPLTAGIFICQLVVEQVLSDFVKVPVLPKRAAETGLKPRGAGCNGSTGGWKPPKQTDMLFPSS